MGCYGVLIFISIRLVYRFKISLSLMYMRVPFCPGVLYAVAWFHVEPVR